MQGCEKAQVASSLDAIQGSGEVIKAVLCQVQAQFKLHKEIVFFNEKKKEEGTSDEKTESKDGLSLSLSFFLHHQPELSSLIIPVPLSGSVGANTATYNDVSAVGLSAV